MLVAMLHVTIGNTDGNLIDLLVFGILQGNKTKWYLILPVGLVWFSLYYFTFKLVILKFNLHTPGRQESDANSTESNKIILSKNDRAQAILAALGGRENILSLDNCITRLRIVVKDMSLIDEAKIKVTGSLGIIKLDAANLQIVYGVQVHLIKAEVEKLL
jgi:PTS system maltose and glucose-specific IIC component